MELKRTRHKPAPCVWVLLALLLVFSAWFYTRTMDRPPACSHAWSMADHYAMALNFQQNGFDLLHPQTYNLSTHEGITAVDFPLPAWLSALIMSLLGKDGPLVFRFLSWLASTIGFVFLYRTICDGAGEGHSFIRPLLITLLCWCLPTLVYFHNGFIPSTWALSFFLIAFWAFSRYQRESKWEHWGIAVAALTLAALLRKPYVLYLGALLLHLVFDKGKRRLWGIWMAGFLLFCAWQLVDWHLMQTYGTLFTRQFRPPQSLQEAWTVGILVWKKWAFTWFSPGHLIWIALLTGLVLINRKPRIITHQRQGALVATVFSIGIFYFFLMLLQFVDHDYYVLDSFYPAFLVLAAVLARQTAAIKWLVYPEAALLALGLFWAERQLDKYLDVSQFYIPEKTNQVYYASRPLLDSLNIPAAARMLVFEAYSFNQPLIGMRRKGYCLLSSRASAQEEWLAKKPDYVTCLDSLFLPEVVQDNPAIVQELDYMGSNQDLLVFRPGNFPENTLENLLAKKWNTLVDTSMETATSEYFFVHVQKPEAGQKILFHGSIQTKTPGALRATVSMSKAGKLIYFQDKPLKINKSGEFIYRSLVLETGEIPADEMKIYIWNPDRMEAAFKDFKISVITPK